MHHTIFLLECDLRNSKKISLLFFMFLFMMAFVELDMDKGDFYFCFLFIRASCHLLSHHLIFLFVATYFVCFALCSKSDKLKFNYCHTIGHLLQEMFHIASNVLLIALYDFLILLFLSFFFMLWIFSSNC